MTASRFLRLASQATSSIPQSPSGDSSLYQKEPNRESLTKGKAKGRVIFEGGIEESNLTSRQKVTVKAARVISEALGIDVYLYESEISNGKRQGDNGWYDPSDRSIHLDIAAGMNGEGIAIFTLSHELTHHLKEVSPAKYKAFAEALFEVYAENGISVDELIQESYDRLKKKGRLKGLTESEAYELAYEESVARACESMLADSDALDALSEKIRAEDKSLWERIKDFISGLAEKIRTAYKGLDPDSKEGKLVREMKDSAERLQRLWTEAVLDASEVDLESTPKSEGVKWQERNTDVKITKSDIDTLRTIPKKSINKFTSEEIKKAEPWARKFYAELGTKSPFFRAWFGDWRAYDTKEFEYVDVNTDFVRKGTIPYGDYYNKDTEWNVSVRSNGVEKTKSQMGVGSNEHRALTDLKKIIDSAVLLDTVVADKPSKKMGATAVFVHHLYCPITMNGKKAIAKLYISEHIGGEHKFYLTKIEEVTHAIGKSTNEGATVHRAKGTAGDTSPTISIAEIFDFVKKNDKLFESDSKDPIYFDPKPANPLFLNEDGTPKVFYHGTGEQFTVFDPAEMRDREGSFFFAENRQDAEGYGSNVYEVYLQADNLANYDDQPLEFYQLRNKRKQVEWLKERGYDGWYADMDSDGWGEVSVFKNTQIKSATDNIGTFDGENPDIRYSDRYGESNRSLLAEALESVAKNDAEREQLAKYKEKIGQLNEQEQRLYDLRRQIKEKSFASGKRDMAEIKSLRDEATKTANRIDILDGQLLKLESTKALKELLEREKARARAEAKAEGEETLKRYRERAAATQAELKARYAESRAKSAESRRVL